MRIWLSMSIMIAGLVVMLLLRSLAPTNCAETGAARSPTAEIEQLSCARAQSRKVRLDLGIEVDDEDTFLFDGYSRKEVPSSGFLLGCRTEATRPRLWKSGTRM